MASESSSAMLDMNDADTEDTEAPSVTEEAAEGLPLIMEHGQDIAVKVDAPMKQLSTLETFVTYRVRCVCARWPTPPYVRRRYNHFKSLHKRLCQAHPLIAPPPLPPLHSARQQLDRYSPSFVAVRTMALHAFLDRVAKHPILTHSEDFRTFLTMPDEELDKVFKSENSALNLWGLGNALSYGSGEMKPSNGARVKDPEFTSAIDYLQSLQQKLTTLCTLTTKLHKGIASLNTEYTSMKLVCDSWSSHSGGAECRGAGALSAGAGAAARAFAPRRPPLHAALLPLLAAHASAHVGKISQRDALHATFVSGASATDDLHNRLEQASEALRSELADWTPKTRAELKRLLLDLADRQVTAHAQALMGWEYALRLCSETDVSRLFKTVSKTAVLNLSPSKTRADATPTETERDLDELEVDSNDSVSREGVTGYDNIISELSLDGRKDFASAKDNGIYSHNRSDSEEIKQKNTSVNRLENLKENETRTIVTESNSISENNIEKRNGSGELEARNSVHRMEDLKEGKRKDMSVKDDDIFGNIAENNRDSTEITPSNACIPEDLNKGKREAITSTDANISGNNYEINRSKEYKSNNDICVTEDLNRNMKEDLLIKDDRVSSANDVNRKDSLESAQENSRDNALEDSNEEEGSLDEARGSTSDVFIENILKDDQSIATGRYFEVTDVSRAGRLNEQFGVVSDPLSNFSEVDLS